MESGILKFFVRVWVVLFGVSTRAGAIIVLARSRRHMTLPLTPNPNLDIPLCLYMCVVMY